ncbi:hypothetical protein H0H87_010332 [Tephrocybe sp. NHM501043]|nr:hypothetical protein H0H87_010332 [Tephrocybe sp. NHM501043]
MAQALFDEHPLEQYLRNAGETQELMPGSTTELESELDPWWGTDLVVEDDEDEDGPEWWPPFIFQATEVVIAVISALDLPSLSNPSSPFVERFKYDVISSTLLAVSLPSTHCLDSLNELVASSDEWETVVQTAIAIVDNDEQSSYGSATPPSLSSSLRIALHSSLLTTQTQCDNVRQLFSALTLPSELSQLSEMPLSLPTRKRTLSMPSDPFLSNESKRQTWNGAYSGLSYLGSPGFKVQQKRRSDLSSLLQTPMSPPSFKTSSAPVTPASSSLPYVSEGSDSEYEDAHDQLPNTADGSMTFGAAALALHRKRKTVGMEAFRLPPPSCFSPVASPHPTPHSPRTPPPLTATYSSGSRFTSVQAGRHPLSLSAIHHAVQNALASKRFACSHLLALRFADEEDEGYWEDVRSVMGLLTTTLVDASSRLSEAITQVEQQKLRDQTPTPLSSIHFPGSEEGNMSVDSSIAAPPPLKSKRPTSISFAPLPSHLSRFAAHLDAITSALDDARENLQQCVFDLREETRTSALDQRRRRRTRNMSTSSSIDEPHPPRSPALEAYERLRRELGLALRECERGRERLLDVVYPPDLYAAEDEGDSGDDVPALGHDGSDESDKPDPTFPFDIEPESPPVGYAVVALEAVDGDDATPHLLLSASAQHLPPPGIEQVFEAETGNVGPFARERSKLTREERIKLMKARRESGGGVLGLDPATPVMGAKKEVEKWGPGGEVVQELKDVIWKVGERRRRMADTNSSPSPTAASSAEPVNQDRL